MQIFMVITNIGGILLIKKSLHSTTHSQAPNIHVVQLITATGSTQSGPTICVLMFQVVQACWSVHHVTQEVRGGRSCSLRRFTPSPCQVYEVIKYSDNTETSKCATPTLTNPQKSPQPCFVPETVHGTNLVSLAESSSYFD